ncbi:MAG: hypothetical protein Q9187_004999 [Circinaria calcarea]
MKAAADELKSPRIPKQIGGKRGQAETSGPLHRRSSRIAGPPRNTEAARKGNYPQSTPDSRKKGDCRNPPSEPPDRNLEDCTNSEERDQAEIEEVVQPKTQGGSPWPIGENPSEVIDVPGSRQFNMQPVSPDISKPRIPEDPEMAGEMFQKLQKIYEAQANLKTLGLSRKTLSEVEQEKEITPWVELLFSM